MADITVTPANVEIVSAGSPQYVQFGETVEPGEVVYKKASDGKYWLAVNTDEAKAVAVGIAVLGGAADSWGYIIGNDGDEIDIGGTVTVADCLVLSDTDGKIMPLADLTTGQHLTIIGYGTAATNIQLRLTPTYILGP